jgi:tRNA dimethylallyltransferase
MPTRARPVIAIFGPTGVGKTAVAVALADALRARGEDPVAVSADALQIYRGLEILTGAADATDQERLEHRLISFVPVTEGFSAGHYARLAHAEIDALREAGRRPIVVGGTGLYLRAALTELDLQPPVDPEIRRTLSARLATEGPRALHAELSTRRPDLAGAIAATDTQRITRALELLAAGVDPAPPGQQLWTDHTRVPTRLFGLTLEREHLYTQIDRRVEAMLAAGVAEEVARAAGQGAGPSAQKAVGFRELLDGDPETMKLRTRQYARRQLTWMRKLPGVELIDMTHTDPVTAAARILAGLDAASLPDR